MSHMSFLTHKQKFKTNYLARLLHCSSPTQDVNELRIYNYSPIQKLITMTDYKGDIMHFTQTNKSY